MLIASSQKKPNAIHASTVYFERSTGASMTFMCPVSSRTCSCGAAAGGGVFFIRSRGSVFSCEQCGHECSVNSVPAGRDDRLVIPAKAGIQRRSSHHRNVAKDAG